LLADWLFDYAGMFPPASLSVEGAWARYEEHLASPRAAILSRFACGSDALAELAEVLGQSEAAPERGITVVATAKGEWGDTLEAAAQAMTAFVERIDPERAALTAFEVALPDANDLPARLQDLRSFQDVDVYVEIPWQPWQTEAFAAVAEQPGLLAKARTGGARVPTAMELANWLEAAIQEEQPFKLTAGLHHALRSDEEHGFLNVAAALALGIANDYSREEIAQVLEERQASAFEFGESALRWRSAEADRDALEDARALLGSIGSCAIEDAWEDLRKWD
jgi:hypothetical protein